MMVLSASPLSSNSKCYETLTDIASFQVRTTTSPFGYFELENITVRHPIEPLETSCIILLHAFIPEKKACGFLNEGMEQ